MSVDLDRLRLARTDGVGPITWRRLMQRFGSAAAALDALPGIARDAGRAAAPAVPSRADALREADAVRRLGGTLLFLGDADYPELLAMLATPPPVLTVLGTPAALARRGVAVVGSRNASANGQRMAETLARELAAAGLVVVSGLARGIDGAAHRGALQSGCTVACVAGGIDVPYPPEHARLQADIAEAGAVVTLAPLGTQPIARHFPRRNQLIAGLALGVVVIEAAQGSGSLITARMAQDTGRELFAVPGSPLDPRNTGSNGLIREGAHLTETAADVIDNLPDHPSRQGIARSPMFARGPAPGAGEDRGAWLDGAWDHGKAAGNAARGDILKLLGPAPTGIDDLVRRSAIPAATVIATLSDLELAGRVEMLPGGRVALLSDREASK